MSCGCGRTNVYTEAPFFKSRLNSQKCSFSYFQRVVEKSVEDSDVCIYACCALFFYVILWYAHRPRRAPCQWYHMWNVSVHYALQHTPVRALLLYCVMRVNSVLIL